MLAPNISWKLRASGIPSGPASQFTLCYSIQQHPPRFWNSTMPWKSWPQKQVLNHPWQHGWRGPSYGNMPYYSYPMKPKQSYKTQSAPQQSYPSQFQHPYPTQSQPQQVAQPEQLQIARHQHLQFPPTQPPRPTQLPS